MKLRLKTKTFLHLISQRRCSAILLWTLIPSLNGSPSRHDASIEITNRASRSLPKSPTLERSRSGSVISSWTTEKPSHFAAKHSSRLSSVTTSKRSKSSAVNNHFHTSPTLSQHLNRFSSEEADTFSQEKDRDVGDDNFGNQDIIEEEVFDKEELNDSFRPSSKGEL